jgi:formate--tetrahydrofolate ligase
MHGGGPRVVPGRPRPKDYREENLDLLEKGIGNLLHHIAIVRKSGMKPVVCINRFHTDTAAEVALVRRHVEKAGARCALGEHWLKGGEGALELADAVIEACQEKPEFRFLYPLDLPLRARVERIARDVYGADGVSWAPEVEEKVQEFDADPKFRDYATMMVKTHLSLSHDPDRKGVPTGWTLPIRDVLLFSGAKFLCPVAGAITLMPGTSSDPAFRRVDVDVETGEVRGLF